jgi:hypothetical protein
MIDDNAPATKEQLDTAAKLWRAFLGEDGKSEDFRRKRFDLFLLVMMCRFDERITAIEAQLNFNVNREHLQ